jgi:hypothetical protein
MGLWHGLGRPFENSGAPHGVWGFVQRGSALFFFILQEGKNSPRIPTYMTVWRTATIDMLAKHLSYAYVLRVPWSNVERMP